MSTQDALNREDEDVWGEGEDDGPTVKKAGVLRFSNPIKGEQKRSIVIVFSVVVLSIVGFIIIPLLSDGDDDLVKVNATETSIHEIPEEDKSKMSLFDGEGIESDEITQARKGEVRAAAQQGKSAIEDVSFFDEALTLQNSEMDQKQPKEDNVYVYGMRQGQRATLDSDEYGRDSRGGNRDGRRNGYDFAEMLAKAKIDTDSWHDEIAKMASSTTKPSYGGDSADPIVLEQAEDVVGPFSDITESNSESISDTPTNNAYYEVLPTEIHWLELLSDINTDEPGVLAEAVSGPLAGARFTGHAVVTQSKRIGIEFTQMVFRGAVYSTQAIVLDPETLAHSVEGKVDSHYFQRYVPFLLAKFAEGYAESLVGTTTTSYDTGGSISETDAIDDANDRIKYAAGSALEGLLPTWEAQLQRKPTGYHPRGSVLMTMFLSHTVIQ